MSKYGIRPGQEVACLFYRDHEFLGACTIRPTTADQVGIQLHFYEDTELVTLCEIAAAALGAIKFEQNKPRLRAMVAERIRELEELEREEDLDDPPPPPNGNLPF
jgi:hypothetical protein